MEEQLHGNI